MFYQRKPAGLTRLNSSFQLPLGLNEILQIISYSNEEATRIWRQSVKWPLQVISRWQSWLVAGLLGLGWLYFHPHNNRFSVTGSGLVPARTTCRCAKCFTKLLQREMTLRYQHTSVHAQISPHLNDSISSLWNKPFKFILCNICLQAKIIITK